MTTPRTDCLCLLCGAALTYWQQGWRDTDGYTTCFHEVPNGPEDLHVPSANPGRA